MSMPIYLKNKFKNINNDFDHKDWMLIGMIMHSLSDHKSELNKNSIKKFYGINVDSLSYADLIKIYLKKAFKIIYGYKLDYLHSNFKYNYLSNYKKTKVRFYCNLEYNLDKKEWILIYKELNCNYYFAHQVEKITKKRLENELEIILKKEELDCIKKIKQGRKFSGRLRQMILERDDYKCVYCGKGSKDGITLEVDHIKEWNDGGDTTYDNGQTVCNNCNKGKYHLKKYKEKINEFNNLVNSDKNKLL